MWCNFSSSCNTRLWYRSDGPLTHVPWHVFQLMTTIPAEYCQTVPLALISLWLHPADAGSHLNCPDDCKSQSDIIILIVPHLTQTKGNFNAFFHGLITQIWHQLHYRLLNSKKRISRLYHRSCIFISNTAFLILLTGRPNRSVMAITGQQFHFHPLIC